MPSTMPLRVGDDLLTSAKLAADAAGRSAAQQIGYWAKLGRELERSGTVSVRDVADVLAGARSYDDLDAKSQAVVRAEWAERTEARRAALNLAERFAAEGRTWVEMTTEGDIVRREPHHAVAGAGRGDKSARAAAKRAAPPQARRPARPRRRAGEVPQTAVVAAQGATTERTGLVPAAKSAKRSAIKGTAAPRTVKASATKRAKQSAVGVKSAAKKQPARRVAGRSR